MCSSIDGFLYSVLSVCVYTEGVSPTSVHADEHQQSNISGIPPADLMKSDQRGINC